MSRFIFKVFFISVLCWIVPCKAKIYDCFLFYNEYEVLKIRLEELYDHVDHFVLVECSETFRGNPKPFNFENNKHLYSKYLDKIIHIKIDERHPGLGVWQREHFQRNCLGRGLLQCHKDDVIFISDVDEIPRASFIPDISKRVQKKHVLGVCLQQTIYFFQLNRSPLNGLHEGKLWFGTAAMTYKKFKDHNAQFFRDKSRAGKLEKLYGAGWHFTYMGGIETVKAKIQGFSHGYDDVSHLDGDWEKQLASYPAVPINDSFPKCIRDNLDYYYSIGLISK
jgi:beta-1,4-mannosyl-glycoprotein beta-1,4-N-acetylglucosaminyltransferase